jgi:hypothetical protein
MLLQDVSKTTLLFRVKFNDVDTWPKLTFVTRTLVLPSKVNLQSDLGLSFQDGSSSSLSEVYLGLASTSR